MKPLVNGHVAMLMGPKYDLDKVIPAHQLIVDDFIARFGAGYIGASYDGRYNKFDWPGKGREVADFFWDNLRKEYDAYALPLVFVIPDVLALQIRLLGMTWCIQDERTGDLKLHDGTSVARLNPQPVISVFGPYDHEAKKFGLLSEDVADAVSDLARGPLNVFCLEFERSATATPATMASGLIDACKFRFPHDVYGDGHALLAVRCVSSDGDAPEPSNVTNPFLEN